MKLLKWLGTALLDVFWPPAEPGEAPSNVVDRLLPPERSRRDRALLRLRRMKRKGLLKRR
ncbi:hypothetical protein KQI63_05795 [bacterium]|nr:hypothetical protein [bacterium]